MDIEVNHREFNGVIIPIFPSALAASIKRWSRSSLDNGFPNISIAYKCGVNNGTLCGTSRTSLNSSRVMNPEPLTSNLSNILLINESIHASSVILYQRVQLQNYDLDNIALIP